MEREKVKLVILGYCVSEAHESQSLDADIVMIRVGSTKSGCFHAEFGVHKQLLIFEGGDFFTAAFRGSWSESANNRIDFPEDDPYIVKSYIYYLYRKTFPTMPMGVVSDNASLERYFTDIQQLAEFGTKVQHLHFLESLDYTVCLLIQAHTDKHDILQSRKIVNQLWKSFPPSSNLRQAILSHHEAHGCPSWYLAESQTTEAWDPELILHLLRWFCERSQSSLSA